MFISPLDEIIFVSETIVKCLRACDERKESRGNFLRNDYPERNPENDNHISICRIVDGKDVIEMMRAPELKPEYQANNDIPLEQTEA